MVLCEARPFANKRLVADYHSREQSNGFQWSCIRDVGRFSLLCSEQKKFTPLIFFARVFRLEWGNFFEKLRGSFLGIYNPYLFYAFEIISLNWSAVMSLLSNFEMKLHFTGAFTPDYEISLQTKHLYDMQR